MSDDEYERGIAEYQRWADVQLAARDAFREGISGDEIRALIGARSEDSCREVFELEQMFKLGEDEQG